MVHLEVKFIHHCENSTEWINNQAEQIDDSQMGKQPESMTELSEKN